MRNKEFLIKICLLVLAALAIWLYTTDVPDWAIVIGLINMWYLMLLWILNS